MRGELDRTLSAIARLNDREQDLLRKLDAVRAQRDGYEAEVTSIAWAVERAEAAPHEHGLLFATDLRAEVMAASSGTL
jgi:hypothetical protein